MVWHQGTCTFDRLLGPCFKTGGRRPSKSVTPVHLQASLKGSSRNLEKPLHCAQRLARVSLPVHATCCNQGQKPAIRRQPANHPLQVAETGTGGGPLKPAGAVDGPLTLRHSATSRTFDAFFKVLFNFRSHYLCTVGFGAIFSLRRSTPPYLCSTLKLHDSWNCKGIRNRRESVERDCHPLW